MSQGPPHLFWPPGNPQCHTQRNHLPPSKKETLLCPVPGRWRTAVTWQTPISSLQIHNGLNDRQARIKEVTTSQTTMTPKGKKGRTRVTRNGCNQITGQWSGSHIPIRGSAHLRGHPCRRATPRRLQTNSVLFFYLPSPTNRIFSHHLGVRESSLSFFQTYLSTLSFEKAPLSFENPTRSPLVLCPSGHHLPPPHCHSPSRACPSEKVSPSLPVSSQITQPVSRCPHLKRGQTSNLYLLLSS